MREGGKKGGENERLTVVAVCQPRRRRRPTDTLQEILQHLVCASHSVTGASFIPTTRCSSSVSCSITFARPTHQASSHVVTGAAGKHATEQSERSGVIEESEAAAAAAVTAAASFRPSVRSIRRRASARRSGTHYARRRLSATRNKTVHQLSIDRPIRRAHARSLGRPTDARRPELWRASWIQHASRESRLNSE